MLAGRGALAGPAAGHGDSILQPRPELMEETQPVVLGSILLERRKACGAGPRAPFLHFILGLSVVSPSRQPQTSAVPLPFKNEEMVVRK